MNTMYCNTNTAAEINISMAIGQLQWQQTPNLFFSKVYIELIGNLPQSRPHSVKSIPIPMTLNLSNQEASKMASTQVRYPENNVQLFCFPPRWWLTRLTWAPRCADERNK